VHRRINGDWVLVQSTWVNPASKHTFYSGLPASYRGEIDNFHGAFVNNVGVGAAWTLSPSLAGAR
jgi:hypothetical protein